MTCPRILMADDHSLVLAGLRELVEEEEEVVGTVEDDRALIEGAKKLRPNIIPREVLQLIVEGTGTKAIAVILNISIKTLEFHRSRLMEELNLHSTAEFTRYAVCEGLVSLGPALSFVFSLVRYTRYSNVSSRV